MIPRKYLHSFLILFCIQFGTAKSSISKGQPLQVSLYEDRLFKGPLIEYDDICTCQNLPAESQHKASSVNPHGHCVKLYEKENCKGRTLILKPGLAFNDDLSLLDFDNLTSSIQICGDVPACIKLNATLLKFKFLSDIPTLLRNAPYKNVELATREFVLNNGSAKATFEYASTKSYKQSLSLEKSSSKTEFSSFTVGTSAMAEISAGFPGFADATLSTELSTCYEKNDEKSSTMGETKGIEGTREFSVKKTIEIPPCSQYEASSFIQVIDDLLVDYEMTLHVTGTYRGKIMRADELATALPPGTKYLRDFHEDAVVAKSMGKMVANIGVDTKFVGHGVKIKECEA